MAQSDRMDINLDLDIEMIETRKEVVNLFKEPLCDRDYKDSSPRLKAYIKRYINFGKSVKIMIKRERTHIVDIAMDFKCQNLDKIPTAFSNLQDYMENYMDESEAGDASVSVTFWYGMGSARCIF